MASGCDQCMWPVGVVVGCGHKGIEKSDQWPGVFKV